MKLCEGTASLILFSKVQCCNADRSLGTSNLLHDNRLLSANKAL